MMLKFPFYARLALTLLAVVLVVFILFIGRNIFIPLVFGLLIGILLFPLSLVFERKLHVGRGVASALSVTLFLSMAGSFIYFMALQIGQFARDIPELKKRFQQIAWEIQKWVAYKFQINTSIQNDYFERSAGDIVQTAARSASEAVFTVIGVVVMFVFVFIFAFFMLYHYKFLMRFVLHLFNVRHREKVHEVVMETKTMINGYVMGLVIEMVIMIVVNSGLLLLLDIRYAILLGVMAAVLNIIPYFGIYVSIVLTMLVTLANNTPGHAMQAGLALFIVHVLDANILMPRIVGSRVKMNPFVTIIAVIIGEAVWGVPGMFLFIPLTGIMKMVCDRVEGLEAWGMLMGVEEAPKPKKKLVLDVSVPGGADNNMVK
ncbi:MAG: AI-2E family transporter [Bacteroidota bacterium]